ncbi:nuclease-related domain-containing protein [Arthrobacter sp. Marseille-P9274]|uniref:nuclease-related domain-containing protein n=1 Tax=Arthrobacter sp. Marseille-P9274 TaxID=2866572 RepID=UPI0021C59985|nr:nuclease-related domain-containing protein [Arthrobacter sp. Marseille-P9274]
MTAGERAAEQSRLAGERAARLRRQAEQAERSARSWAAGAAGEVRVAAELRELEARGWRLLNDAHWPGRPKANLDDVLVGPGGILVVDAKNWTGRVELRNGRLTQNGYSRVRETTGVLEQGAAVAAVLEPRHRRLVQGWICLVNHPQLRTESADGVRIVGLESLQFAVNILPPLLESAEIDMVFHHLQQLLSGRASPALLNTAAVGLPGHRPDFSPEPAPAFAQESALHDSLAALAPTSSPSTATALFGGSSEATGPFAGQSTAAVPGGRPAKGRRRQQSGGSEKPSGRRRKGSGRRRSRSRNRRAGIVRLIVLAVIVVAFWTFAGNANRSSAVAPSTPQPPTVNSQTADQSP